MLGWVGTLAVAFRLSPPIDRSTRATALLRGHACGRLSSLFPSFAPPPPSKLLLSAKGPRNQRHPHTMMFSPLSNSTQHLLCQLLCGQLHMLVNK